MLTYSEAFMRSNREAIRLLEEYMGPEGTRAAKAMLAEFAKYDDEEEDD